MADELKLPKTLLEAVAFYSDKEFAHDTMVALRWSDGVECPRCGSTEVVYLKAYQRFNCRGCRKQFTAKLGTIFEDSPIGFDKWLPTVWMLSNCKNGISSCELARDLGITQKSAWFMLHRVRHAMKANGMTFGGIVEADETFVGGLNKNKHKEKKNSSGNNSEGKTIVAGVLQRGDKARNVKSQVKATVVPDRAGITIAEQITSTVEHGAELHTDGHKGYRSLKITGEYTHKWIDHNVEYASGKVHTNGMENFWSLLKRSLKGTYVAVMPFHLERYVDEQAWRFNMRGLSDGERFLTVLRSITGRRLTYEQLTSEYSAFYDMIGL